MTEIINAYWIDRAYRTLMVTNGHITPVWRYSYKSKIYRRKTAESLINDLKADNVPFKILDENEYHKKLEEYTIRYDSKKGCFKRNVGGGRMSPTVEDAKLVVKMIDEGKSIGDAIKNSPNKRGLGNIAIAYMDGLLDTSFMKIENKSKRFFPQSKLDVENDVCTVTDSMSVDLAKPLTRDMVAEDLSKRIGVLESKIDFLIDNCHNGCQKCEIEEKENKGWIQRILKG